MGYERVIVQRLFESKGLAEAEFQSGGSTYKCAFGKYYKDGEQISREDYFKAKETGSSSSNQFSNIPVDLSNPPMTIKSYIEDVVNAEGGELEEALPVAAMKKHLGNEINNVCLYDEYSEEFEALDAYAKDMEVVDEGSDDASETYYTVYQSSNGNKLMHLSSNGYETYCVNPNPVSSSSNKSSKKNTTSKSKSKVSKEKTPAFEYKNDSVESFSSTLKKYSDQVEKFLNYERMDSRGSSWYDALYGIEFDMKKDPQKTIDTLKKEVEEEEKNRKLAKNNNAHPLDRKYAREALLRAQHAKAIFSGSDYQPN